MKVIVVGGGIMGLCAAWALRRAGWQVALYEQGPLPNPLASSFDQHRLIRYAYGAMSGYARMVREAYAAWDRLWADLGRSHYYETGTLVVARDEDDWVRRSLDCLAEMRIPVESWQPARFADRMPFLDLRSASWALFLRPAASCSPSASCGTSRDTWPSAASHCTRIARSATSIRRARRSAPRMAGRMRRTRWS